MTNRMIRPEEYRAMDKRARQLRAEGVRDAVRAVAMACVAAGRRFEAWDAGRRILRRL